MKRQPSKSCVVVAPLGPNPASLVELIWALGREWAFRVGHVFVVTTPEGRGWLQQEVLRADGALDELCDVLGQTERPRIDITELAVDDAIETDGHAWREGTWAAARRAVAEAGESPVVFGLLAGRRRTMTAMATVTAQLLAREHDRCVDVRVSDRRAEGGSGFFFPEQNRRWLDGPRGSFDAREVEVQLVEVPVPRLAGLIGEGGLTSWDTALAAGQKAIDGLRPPELVVTLTPNAAVVTVDGNRIPLAGAKLLAFLSLVFQRLRTGEGWVRSSDEVQIRELLSPLGALPWTDSITSKGWEHVLNPDPLIAFDIKQLTKARSDLRRQLLGWCQSEQPGWQRWLVPEVLTEHVDGSKRTSQRLPLGPQYVTLIEA